jgi:hypothetical protein
MAPPELSELRKLLKELIDAGIIISRQTLEGTVRGTGAVPEEACASLRLCIDYRALNNTKKKKEPVPPPPLLR